MRSLSRFFCLSLIAASTNVAAVSSGDAATAVGTCRPVEVKFSASDKDQNTTTSTTFINLPEAVINFTQGGRAPSCVIVYFTGMVAVGSNGQLFVRAVMDGSNVGLPELFQFIALSNNFSHTHTASFIFPSVAPGAHQMRIQYSSGNGQTVVIGRHNTVANYAP
jgi:hypothetical protein